MSTEHNTKDRGQDDREKPEHKIEVTVNGKERKIRPGTYTVADLKEELKVNQDLALSQDINGTLTPLADDAHVTIKGGEAFFSSPRTGGSSHE
jgi:hypothetical protein